MMEQAQTRTVEAPRRKPLAWLLEFFLMRRRFAELHAQGLDLEHPDFAARSLAFTLLRDAHQLATSPAGQYSALALYRSAVRLLLHGRGLEAQPSAAESGRADNAQLEELLASPPLAAVLDGESGEARLATVSGEARERLLVDLRSAAQRLADERLDDHLRVRRLVWTRRFRLLALGAVLGACSFLLWRSLEPKNLALNRPVETSPQDPNYAVPARRLVDGDELNLGFHSAAQENASATIDLGEVRAVGRIELFNRADCCQDRAVPLTVQVSKDGREFSTVARRTRVFYDWTVKLPRGTRARFVRVKHETNGFFHLAEIKVF
jgi:hypothetical protein